MRRMKAPFTAGCGAFGGVGTGSGLPGAAIATSSRGKCGAAAVRPRRYSTPFRPFLPLRLDLIVAVHHGRLRAPEVLLDFFYI
jgi:hypothetical protein